MINNPSFVSIGPGRCGTSWLYEVLNAHPEVGMARVKETEFFNTNFHKGVTWYEEHFPQGPHRAIGEISNNYYLDDQVAERLVEYRKDMKLIVSLRNPFTLLKSFYGYGQRRGLESVPLAKFVSQPIGPVMGSGYMSREKAGRLTTSDSRTVLESVLLGERFAPFYAVFDRSRIYVLVYERLRHDPWEVLREVYDFLGVTPDYRPAMAGAVVNEAVTPRSRFFARLVSQVAYLARTAGAYRLLTWGHRSRVVKKLLYTKPASEPRSGDCGEGDLPLPVRARIRADLQSLIKLDPSLSPWVAKY
jgi:hypothetical protein